MGGVEPTVATSSAYNLVHPTWTAVQSLRDRTFEYDRKGNAQWAQFMNRLLKQVDLHKLEVKVKYPKPRKYQAPTSGPPQPRSLTFSSARSSPREASGAEGHHENDVTVEVARSSPREASDAESDPERDAKVEVARSSP